MSTMCSKLVEIHFNIMLPSKLYDYRLIVAIINALYFQAQIKLFLFVFKILTLIFRDKLVYLVMGIKRRRYCFKDMVHGNIHCALNG